MPDRTIPFYNLILRCDTPSPAEPVLPEGYALRTYVPGDEAAWARLERDIGDFASTEEAEAYFRDTYLRAGSDICERGVFAVHPAGDIVGSCIAWRDLRGGDTVASLHWLVVDPAFRGLGLGKALCRRVLQIFARRGEAPVYIHTQPWSCKAIVLYVREGFRLQAKDTFSHYENQFPEAMGVLHGVLPEKLYEELLDHADDVPRCPWANPKNPRYLRYHDREWGVPCHDEQALYELFLLESFQAGLSWETILNKRESFRAAFDGFDIDRVCAYGESDIARLMNDAGIVRNRRKITAAIQNSRIFRDLQAEFGSWDAYIWGFTGGETIFENDPAVTTSPLSDRISRDLRHRGMSFVGSTIIYSYLQAIGVISAHAPGCWKGRFGR